MKRYTEVWLTISGVAGPDERVTVLTVVLPADAELERDGASTFNALLMCDRDGTGLARRVRHIARDAAA
ncbi:hypothetical protein [Saccharopolyspora taberi]|uniref:Uncharacterized protein n=1 Tax=Saccharopolyspora taberi TaxID=60895 RepID=A0ABN3V745_9PSEU